MKKLIMMGFALLFTAAAFGQSFQNDFFKQDEQEERLYAAAGKGDMPEVRRILSQTSRILDEIGNPVENALANGHNDIARLLLKKGYSAAKSQPVIAAAKANNLEGVKMLAEEYNVWLDDSMYDFSPLEIAFGQGYTDMVDYLLNRGVQKYVGEIDFRRAVARNFFDLVKLALDKKMVSQENIESSLQAIIGYKDPEALAKMGGLLLKHGARLDYAENYSLLQDYLHEVPFLRDDPALTAMERAVNLGNVNAVDWLLKAGANPKQAGHNVMACAADPKCEMSPKVRTRLLQEQVWRERAVRELRNFFRKNPVR